MSSDTPRQNSLEPSLAATDPTSANLDPTMLHLLKLRETLDGLIEKQKTKPDSPEVIEQQLGLEKSSLSRMGKISSTSSNRIEPSNGSSSSAAPVFSAPPTTELAQVQGTTKNLVKIGGLFIPKGELANLVEVVCENHHFQVLDGCQNYIFSNLPNLEQRKAMKIRFEDLMKVNEGEIIKEGWKARNGSNQNVQGATKFIDSSTETEYLRIDAFRTGVPPIVLPSATEKQHVSSTSTVLSAADPTITTVDVVSMPDSATGSEPHDALLANTKPSQVPVQVHVQSFAKSSPVPSPPKASSTGITLAPVTISQTPAVLLPPNAIDEDPTGASPLASPSPIKREQHVRVLTESKKANSSEIVMKTSEPLRVAGAKREGPSPKRNRADFEENDENKDKRSQPNFDDDMDSSKTDDLHPPQSPAQQTGERADSSSGTSNQNRVIAAEACYVCNKNDRHNKAVGTLGCDRGKCAVAVDGFFYRYDVRNSEGKIKSCQYCSKCVDKVAKLKKEVETYNAVRQHNTAVLEEFVECKTKGCARRAHEKCASALEYSDSFECDRCLMASGKEQTREAKATDIEHTEMSRYCEQILSTKFPEAELYVRELNRSQAKADIEDVCPAPYKEYFAHVEGATITSQTLAAFQTNEGKDSMIGVFFIKGCSKIQDKYWLLVDYLDTVWAYTKKELEEDKKKWADIEARGGAKPAKGQRKLGISGKVAQTILETMFMYKRDEGYTHAHLWARAPKKGSDYCFFVHPEHQVYATKSRLEKWYNEIFEKMKKEGQIKNFYTFGQLNLSIKSLADISKLPAFPDSIWAIKMDWALADAQKSQARNKDTAFLKSLNVYTKKHMNDNYVIELNPGEEKSAPVVNVDELMVVAFAMDQKSFLGFSHEHRLGSHTIRDQQATAGALIVEYKDTVETNLRMKEVKEVMDDMLEQLMQAAE